MYGDRAEYGEKQMRIASFWRVRDADFGPPPAASP